MNVGKLSAMGAVAVLDDEAGWSSDTASFAVLLNHNYPPGAGGGDGGHHIPYGVSAGLEAAEALGGVWEVLTENAEIPEGAVS